MILKASNLVLAAVLVIVAFAAGWLAASAQNLNKRGLGEITANRWMGDLGLLVDNAHSLKRLDPARTQAFVRQGLDIDSRTLAGIYDGLSPALRKQLAFYIPMAHAAAAVQPTTAIGLSDGRALATFADCMQKAQAQGGSVGKCFESRVSQAKP